MFVQKPIPLVLVAVLVCAVPAAADDIALSLVHGQDRIDIPASAITRIEAHATQTFTFDDTHETKTYDLQNVELCFSAEIHEKICQLTQRIIEQPLNIIVDCAVISSPVVREPLCKMPCFLISANDLQEANALAQRLKTGSNRRCAPVS